MPRRTPAAAAGRRPTRGGAPRRERSRPFAATRPSSLVQGCAPPGEAGRGPLQPRGAWLNAASSPTAKCPSPSAAWTRRNLASFGGGSSAFRVRIPSAGSPASTRRIPDPDPAVGRRLDHVGVARVGLQEERADGARRAEVDDEDASGSASRTARPADSAIAAVDPSAARRPSVAAGAPERPRPCASRPRRWFPPGSASEAARRSDASIRSGAGNPAPLPAYLGTNARRPARPARPGRRRGRRRGGSMARTPLRLTPALVLALSLAAPASAERLAGPAERRQPEGLGLAVDRSGRGERHVQQPEGDRPRRHRPPREDLGRPRPVRDVEGRLRHLRRRVPVARRREREHRLPRLARREGRGAAAPGRLLRPLHDRGTRGVHGHLLEELHVVGALLLRPRRRTPSA